MVKVVLIRHGQTLGNSQKRYIGTTDEHLLSSSTEQIKKHSYPNADLIYVSPLKRCIETAQLIYKDRDYVVEKDFRECDFGLFENKNYIELSDNEYYREWLKSEGKMPFPKGEDISEFKNRCITAFRQSIVSVKDDNAVIAFVVHGGTIMSIMEYFSAKQQSFYHWQVENANGYIGFINQNLKIDMVEKIW